MADGAAEHADRDAANAGSTADAQRSPGWSRRSQNADWDTNGAIGGATEHVGGRLFQGVLAFSNLGLPGAAFTGQQWFKKKDGHEDRLLRLVQDLFGQAGGRGRALLGILLNEVGNLSDLVKDQGRKNMDAVLQKAFQLSCQEAPNIHWSEGETMVAFRPGVEVQHLDPLKDLTTDAPWRTVERLVLSGVSEHGRCKLLVFNQHQPKSQQRKFPQKQKLEFCTKIIKAALQYCADEPQCVGFVFGGDANITQSTWLILLAENKGWRDTFENPRFLHGHRHRGGDVILAGGRKGANLRVFDNNCRVKGRELQHDPMYFEWSCEGHRVQRTSLPDTAWRTIQPDIAWVREIRARHEYRGTPGKRSAGSTGGTPEHTANLARNDTAHNHETEEPVHVREAEPNGASEHVEGAVQGRGAEEETDHLVSETQMDADFGSPPPSPERAVQDGLEADDASSRGSHDWDDRRHDGFLSDEGAPNTHEDIVIDEEDLGVGVRGREESAPNTDEQFEELGAIGFAFANSAALLPEFQVPGRPIDCLDAWWKKTFAGTCTPEDRENLNSCMIDFFLRRPVLQSTPLKEDKESARVLKTTAEIRLAWERIFERRRRGELDDTREIQSADRLRQMWNEWMQDWLNTEATEEQRKRKRNKQTSLFNAWVYRNVGGKRFVMAIWQTGITWAPPQQLLNTNRTGALEHVAKHFASWTRRLARAVTRHKNNPATVEARIRSGNAPGMHGLTEQQLADREARRKARSTYYQAVDLYNQLKASKGRGRGRAGKKPWDRMSQDEKWKLEELWNGRLRKILDEAEGKCHRVQAGDFRIFEHPETMEQPDQMDARVRLVARQQSAAPGGSPNRQ